MPNKSRHWPTEMKAAGTYCAQLTGTLLLWLLCLLLLAKSSSSSKQTASLRLLLLLVVLAPRGSSAKHLELIGCASSAALIRGVATALSLSRAPGIRSFRSDLARRPDGIDDGYEQRRETLGLLQDTDRARIAT